MECDLCKQTYKNKNLLYQHKYIVHRPLVKCDFRGCNKTMKKASLKVHMIQQHDVVFVKKEYKTSNKPLKCPEQGCHKIFETKLKLYNHQYYTHKDKKQCPVDGCDSQIRPHNMRVHLKQVHSGSFCGECGAKIRKAKNKRPKCKNCI